MQFLFILIRFDSIRFGLQYEIYKLLIAIILIKKTKIDINGSEEIVKN